MTPLPKIMVAPNGSYKTKKDHPNIPITHDEIIREVRLAHEAGADGAHLHIRTPEQRHLLEAAPYRALIDALSALCPDLYIQITTEAGGIYSPAHQRKLIMTLAHPYVSASIAEISSDRDTSALAELFNFCQKNGIEVQHICYAPKDVISVQHFMEKNIIPPEQNRFLFVLGRYNANQQSAPSDLDQFLQLANKDKMDWAVCAFGTAETACLAKAIKNGGKARIGFENNLLSDTGKIAQSNAERVKELIAFCASARPI